MRGKVADAVDGRIIDRITPAYAGKSLCIPVDFFIEGDHPRVCGEKAGPRFLRCCLLGSPPRMRGKVRLTVQGLLPPQDHPRVCGEKNSMSEYFFAVLGSPPRMRGKEAQHFAGAAAPGITPAYAGKSCTQTT